MVTYIFIDLKDPWVKNWNSLVTKIGSISVPVFCVTLVGSVIVFFKKWLHGSSLTKWVRGIFRISTVKSTTTIILSYSLFAFSKDQDRFLQKGLSKLGERYVQQLRVTNFDTNAFTVFWFQSNAFGYSHWIWHIYNNTPPKLFLSFRKVVLKPSIWSCWSKMPESRWDYEI